MIISTNAENVFDKIQHSFTMKTTQQSRNRREIPHQIMKGNIIQFKTNEQQHPKKTKTPESFPLR